MTTCSGWLSPLSSKSRVARRLTWSSCNAVMTPMAWKRWLKYSRAPRSTTEPGTRGPSAFKMERKLLMCNPGCAQRLNQGLARVFRLAALTAAQRARAAAAILAREAALILRRGFFGVTTACFCLAQRAFCAAPILARAAALIFRRRGLTAAICWVDMADGAPRILASLCSRASILFRTTTARFNCLTDTLVRVVTINHA